MSKTISQVIGDDIGLITLDNPERKNVISIPLLTSLSADIDELLASSVRVIVIAGSGDSFSAGYDIGLLKEEFFTREQGADLSILQSLLRRIEELPVPVIAMIRGFCIGAGFDLASACDFRIAASSSRFGITPAKIGLVYPVQGIQRVSRIVGEGFAREMFFTGSMYSADVLYSKGFLVSVHDDETLYQETIRFADTLSRNSLTSICGMKKLYTMMHMEPFQSDACAELTENSIIDSDLQEGVSAFAEGRAPDFRKRT